MCKKTEFFSNTFYESESLNISYFVTRDFGSANPQFRERSDRYHFLLIKKVLLTNHHYLAVYSIRDEVERLWDHQEVLDEEGLVVVLD